jgi:hypothetical protein
LYEGGSPENSTAFWYPVASLDPLTNEPVERPVGIIKAGVQHVRATPSVRWNLGSEPPPQYNSLAEIEQQAKIFEGRRQTRIASANQARKQWVDGRNDREAEAAKKLQMEQRATQAAVQAAANKGLIHRNPSYWRRFDREEVLGGIFNGADVEADSYDFMSIYVNYHGWFSNTCSSWVPAGSPYVVTGTTTTTKYDQIGVTHWNEPTRVRQKYWEKYREYRGSVAGFWGEKATQFGMSTSGAMALLSVVNSETASMNADMERLFNDNACDSGLLNQLEENMHRLALSRPTLQQDTAQRYSYAAKDAAVPGAASSLEDACIDHRLQSEADASQRPRIRQWCRCADGRAAKVLTREETQAATRDFEAFYRKVTELPKGGENDPAWRYYDGIRNACSR